MNIHILENLDTCTYYEILKCMPADNNRLNTNVSSLTYMVLYVTEAKFG